jgi:2-C-methyl-D-erythritol 4-phosphate cytidylyltransferase
MAKRGVIIVAGGVGQRMGATMPKQFMMLGQEPVLARTINLFSEALPKAELVVVLPEEHIALWRNIAARFDVAPHKIASGGKERFDSVKSGLAALSDEVETIAVHDAVRPLATKKLIIRLALAAEEAEAVIPVVAPHDSIRQVEGERSYIVDRSQLRMVQTPQFFQAEVLRRAYEQSFSPLFTDDASVVEAAGGEVTLIEGEVQNIKITTPIDLTIAEAILAERDEA